MTITGLNLNGGGTGRYGIFVTSAAALHLYNMRVQNFAGDGISFGGSKLSLYDSKVTDNGRLGMGFYGAQGNVENTAFDNNATNGVFATGGYVLITGSSSQNNGVGFQSDNSTMVLDNDRISNNGTGLSATALGHLYFAHCAIANNTYFYSNAGTLAGSNPATSLIAPGQASAGALSAPVNLD